LLFTDAHGRAWPSDVDDFMLVIRFSFPFFLFCLLKLEVSCSCLCSLYDALRWITIWSKHLLRVLRVRDQIVRQRLQFLWGEYRPVRSIRLFPDADDGALLVSVHDIKLAPRSDVVDQPVGVIASKEVSELIGIDVLKQFLFVRATYYLYLLPGLLVNEALHDCPNALEYPGSIHDHELPQLLRVVVLRNARAQLHQ